MITSASFPVLYLKSPIKIADLLTFAEDTPAGDDYLVQGSAQDEAFAKVYPCQFSLSVRHVSEFSGRQGC